MNEVDFLVKLRDAACMIKDACEERLETLAPKSAKSDSSPDFEGIIWKAATGPKGAYEKSEDTNNPRFQALLKTLQVHHGKMTVDGFILWVFVDQSIGRKKTER